MYTVRVTGSDWWQDRVYYLSTGGLEREGVMPALKKLDAQFRKTLTMLFKPGGGPGETYAHGYTGSYLRGLHSVVTPDSLKIVEGSAKGGREIREGGKPGSILGIWAWAMDKLGLPSPAATRLAVIVASRPRVGMGNSPMKKEHPVGQGKFAFPEWIVTVKNREDIERASRTVESMIVRYLN